MGEGWEAHDGAVGRDPWVHTAGQERPAWNSPHQPQAPSRSWTPPHSSLDWPPEHVAPVGGKWRGSPFLILVACIEVVWVGQVHQA